ncbi:MAG: copper homeostasis protein CutC [Acidobacteria bacterium]|nr:copper homeostasis protein CutC [Acidobacteriota bacterium]
MRPLIEICVDSVGSAAAAQAGGADRVELCDNLIEGGTTPSAGAIALACEKLKIPVNVIIRPRGGDFCYSDIEFEVMKRDISTAKDLGANGIVIGILLPDGRVDEARTRELIRLARPMSVTFHRAFDMTRDPFETLDSLIALGVDRILTSGQEATAAKGTDLIGRLVERAGDRISIMACGEIREENAGRIVAETGAREIHFTAFVEKESEMEYRNQRVYMGNELCPEYVNKVTDAEKIAGVIRAVEEPAQA